MNEFSGLIFIFLSVVFVLRWLVIKLTGHVFSLNNYVDRRGVLESFDGVGGNFNDNHFIDEGITLKRRGFSDGHSSSSVFDSNFAINPASGLPMTDGIGGFDIKGNPYGSDF
ncbi:MAG: hypothetical protein ACXWTY_09585 [Methylobacter sp.]